MKEFKGTPGPWFEYKEGFSTVYVEARIPGGLIQEVAACGPTEAGSCAQQANARLIAAAPELLEALQWALPLAKIAMSQHQLERCQNGHTDITGTYKNGVTWAGIYQEEVDQIEKADAAINKALGIK